MTDTKDFAGATPTMESMIAGLLKVQCDRLLSENAALKAQVDGLNQGIAELERRVQADYAASIIADLKADRDRLQAELDGVRAAIGAMLCGWDALPIGEHLVSRTQEWLNSDVMRNGVNGLRAALSTNAESREPTEQGGS